MLNVVASTMDGVVMGVGDVHEHAFIPPRSFTQLARDAPQVMSQIREEVTLRRAWDRVQDHKPG